MLKKRVAKQAISAAGAPRAAEGCYWFAERPPDAGHGFPVLVFDADGQIDLPLSIFAAEARRRKALGTVRAYLYAVLPFFTWLAGDHWQPSPGSRWDSSPTVVRQAVESYLIDRLGCQVDEHRLGFRLVSRSATSPRTIHVFLSGLKLFYRIMRIQGMYAAAHPLVDSLAATIGDVLDRLIQEDHLPPPMPLVSGVQAPPPAPTQRLSENYFRLRGGDWVPHVIDDPSFPRRVIAGGRALPSWSVRDECVVRLLFESGARISEVVGLSIGDWIAEGLSIRARTFDKGSRGDRVKVLRFRPGTSKLLRRYINGERRRYDPDGRGLQDYARLGERGVLDLQRVPVFLTRRGTPLTPKTFRQTTWNPACAAAGIAADPHQARHWFVTACVREIFAASDRGGDVQRGKEALIAYMGWRSGEQVLRAYEHHLKTEVAAAIQDRVHASMDRRVRESVAAMERGEVRETQLADREGSDGPEMALLRRLL